MCEVPNAMNRIEEPEPQTCEGQMSSLLPCPFCGCVPAFPNGDGTQYEIECDCGMAHSCVQISDLMTMEERCSDDFSHYRYGEEYVERAKLEALKNWNVRVR